MYLIDAFFSRQNNQFHLEQQSHCVNQIIEQWCYNGQIIGREIPQFAAEQKNQQGLAVRVTCPEQTSLLAEFNNQPVNDALQTAEKCGVSFESFHIVAEDLNSEITATETPAWQLLYTTYLQSCSPLQSGESLQPIPLYKQLKNIPHLAMDLVKWQENWQACDQLQMNGSVLEQQALVQISDTQSTLFKHGYHLTQEIERHSGIPTYYYLYRIGGKSCEAELQSRCPLCKRKWTLSHPLFDFLYFKCDHCRLVSNLSWHWQ
ncbi:Zn-ribbon-containing protein [Aggregatibacter actinomycetemcomitans]|uniref:Zn-ribbon-containing protein n=1 Tax=Aggregatibacter actinomycetemcomitans TaxID=714 RepID=UPI001E403C98|nr:Zn-ribbon-containing protein [Aggregatibacter actinomycetemcomitans]